MQQSHRISLLVAGYCIGNVAILMAYGMSLLGPVPFELIFLLAFCSFAGALALPVFVHRQIGWIKSAIGSAGFAAVFIFDVWCLFSASAAV